MRKSFQSVRLSLATLAAAAYLASAPAQANLITTNAGFETGNLSGWSAGGDVAVANCAAFIAGCAPGGGNYLAALNLDGTGNAQITRTVFLPGPGVYVFGLSYVLGTNVVGGNNDVADFTLAVLPSGPYPGTRAVPNTLGAAAFPLSSGGNVFTQWRELTRTYTHTGGAATALVNINLQDYGTGSRTYFFVDNAYVRQVPEPAALALLGLGLLGLGLVQRKRT